MAQQRCDATIAFTLLRQASQKRNIKLRELTAEIVEAVAGHPPEPGTFQPRSSIPSAMQRPDGQAEIGQVEQPLTPV